MIAVMTTETDVTLVCQWIANWSYGSKCGDILWSWLWYKLTIS